MSFDQFAVQRRAPERFAIRALAIGVTTALIVLFMPTAAFAVPGAPDAPAKPTVATGDASVSVTFVAPADNGSAITGYTATCTSSNGGATGSNSGATSAITVSSLTNAASYTCTVHATNINGNSAESAASDAVIAGAPRRPAPPTVTHGDGVISVAFVAPAANGSTIQFFTANCSSSDGGTAGATADLASPIAVSGLDNGKTYTCTVSATNVRGTGVASVASASTVPAAPPDAPVKPTVARGNGQITVTFVAPANNGSAITGYTAACTSSNGGTFGSQIGASSPLVVTGLTNGKSYTCTVHATSAEGSSAESLPSTATVPATVPSTPAQPTIVHGNAIITVTFTESVSNGGSLITGYTASCASSNGGTSGSNTGTASPIVVSLLTNGKTYTCTVHGTNALGDSAESAASTSTVPASTPDVPAQPTVTRGNTQISVAFVAPANNGSTITGYTAACTSSNGGVFGSHSGGVSPIVVDSLTNGMTYTCTVSASNAEGASAPSAPSVSTVPATLPSAPAQPTVTHGNALISVAFSPPASNGGSAITGYTASCASSDGGAAGSNTGAGSPIVVSTLTNGKTYTCTVFATNATGAGDVSVASASTVPATVPGTPAQPTVTHGNALISVAFSPPAGNGGSAITGYTVSCASSDGGAAGSNTGAGSPIVVSTLTNGKTYTCVVHATNAEGAGSDSVVSASTIPATIPGTPAQPTISASGTTITVTFVAPANGGSAITGYSVSCISSNGGTSGSNTGASSSIGVTGLTLGKSYTCTLHATNAEGDSVESAASDPATVPAVVPTAPSQPTVTRGAAAISVAFVAPFNGGSVITGYTASCASSDGGASGANSGATSPIVVSSLTNGKTYTCTVHATNAVGNSSESAASATVVPATVPDAPAAPTLTHGNAQISVAFVAPAGNGNAITGYSTSCTSSDGGVSGSNTGATSPIVVSSLTNGKTYTCTVFATNAIGDGLPSAASSSTVPATVPTAPAQPTVTHHNASIAVAFSAPANGGSAITGYTASCTSSNGGASGFTSGASSPITVTALTNGKTYTCTVHATNAEGNSTESAASASTVPATVPDAPAKPTTVAGVTSIAVTFVAPADGSSAITGYTAACTSSDGGSPGSQSGASSPLTVTGLSKGKTYTCTVHATNAEGSSGESPASNATGIAATAPDAPAQPTVTHGNALISVAFVAPADGGSAITGYTANCVSSNGGASGSNTGATSPIVVSVLNNGKTYTCTVIATNAINDSAPSAASAATIPATTPTAPAQPTVTHGNALISVAFAAPANGGSAITGYAATCTSSDGGAAGSNTGSATPIVVSSLDNGKTYTCTVHATNAEGNSGESAASASTVPATVPNVPAQPTVTHGNALISVAFVAPANGGSVITGYTATCTSSDGGAAGSNTGGSTPIVVSSLTNGKTYTCVVHGTNAEGSSSDSAASASTVPATTPGTPAQPTLTHGNAQISVAFVAPANGGSAITGYTATCTSSDGGAAGNNAASSSPIVVSSLTNGKIYTCVVHATNAEGSGSDSVSSASTIPATTPTAPAPPTVTHGNALISVAFVAPANGGSAITGYTASCVSSDGGTAGSNTGSSTPIVVSSLTNGKSYTCVVRATNAEGSGSDSAASAATAPATVPDAPAAPTATRGNALISVAFLAPANGGSVITGYTATCTSSDGGTAGNNAASSSPIVVSSLTNGKTYTCTVHATNAEGNSTESAVSGATVPASAPSAPAKPTTVAAGTHITVSFVAPATGGSAITGYTVSCVSSNGGTSGSNAGASSPIAVPSLSKGKSYTCTVHATNAAGDSAESPASDVTVVPATVADAPAKPTTTFGNGQISVAFVAPNDGGSAITGYSANCTSTDGGTPGSQPSGSSPIIVTGLDNGKTYTCTVLATNGVGDSDASVASDATVPATVPGTPAAPTVTRGNAQISVAFVAPANGGSAITGYTAACSSSDGGTAGSNTGSSSPIVVSSLTNGKTYTCTVLATNGAGNGAASSASSSAVPATVPAAPAAPTLTHGNARISVAFVAPANGGAAITGYAVSCSSSDGGAAGSNTGSSSPIVVSSLTNGKTYTCTVVATNAVGSGSPSAVSASTVPATVPTAPAAPAATRGNASISVAFVAPANGGSAITGYTASCSSSDGGTSGSNSGAATPIVVSSLTNGKTYTCTVHATNAEGNSNESAASSSAVPATVPAAPAKPTTTPGATSISVAFVAPSNGGSAITGYTASCSSSNGGTAGSNSGATSPIVVSSLSKGKTYTCTVLATNVIGNSSASPASDATVVPATVPNAPAASTLTHGDASISSAFVAPSDGGSAITGYTASCTSSNGGTAGNNTGAATPIVVSALTNGMTYTCTVHATNVVGNSTESVASASTMPNVVPNAPAKPTVVAVPGRITVRFTAPSNTGTTITGYTATCTSSDGGATRHNIGASSPIVVSSLTNGKRYSCTVHATNAEGSGSESAASTSVQVAIRPHNTVAPTISGVPIAQRLLTAHRGTWTGSPAPAFHYQWLRCNGLVNGCANIAGAASATYRLTEHDVDKRIRLIVSATNVAGAVTRATAATAVVRTLPGAITGAYYYHGGYVKRAASNVVGTATHGPTVWTVTGLGNVTGPRFGPNGGTLVGTALTMPIVGMEATPTGRGYWLFAGDGGVFTFGDAHFFGSTGAMHLNAPIVAMEVTPSGKGYWLFASDGGVFTFGNASFHGSTGGSSLAHPAVAMLATQTGSGYWIVTTDGRAYPFGDARPVGGVTRLGRTDIVGLVSTGYGYRFVTKSLQLLAP